MNFKINDVLKVNKTYKNSKFKKGTLVRVVDVGSQNECAVTDGNELWWYNAKDLTRRKSVIEDTVKIEKSSNVITVPPEASIKLHNGYGAFIVQNNGSISAIEQNKGSGVKHDSEKPDMSLLATSALLEMAKVMTFGKRKYSANNWRGGIAWTRVLAAAMRHLTAFNGGEDKDPETGISHLAHCACCLMFLLEFENTHKELDDRYKKENDGKR